MRTQTIPSIGGYAFSAKGDLFAAGGDIWRVSDGSRVRAFTSTAYPMPAFAPDGQLVAIGLSLAEEYQIDVWSLADGSLLRRLTNCCHSLGVPPVFTPESKLLSAVTAPYHITEFWRIDDGDIYGSLYDLPTQYGDNVYTKLLAFSPDSQLILPEGISHRIENNTDYRQSRGRFESSGKKSCSSLAKNFGRGAKRRRETKPRRNRVTIQVVNDRNEAMLAEGTRCVAARSHGRPKRGRQDWPKETKEDEKRVQALRLKAKGD